MAHFLLTPVGSSGDVHPFIGVGRGLKARGHDVTIVTAEPFRLVSERAGLRFVPTQSTAEFEQLAAHPKLWHPRLGPIVVLRAVASVLRSTYACIGRAYESGRTVLVGHFLSYATRVFEEVHEAPAATLQLAPSAFRSLYQQPAYAPGHDASGWPRWLKRSTWWSIDHLVVDPRIVPQLNRWRRELGLRTPVQRIFKDWLHSPQRVIGMFPDWFGPPQPDWPAQLRLTGFPLYDESDQHAGNPGLERFLSEGEGPILFTPGSANQAAAAFFEAAVDAVMRLGRRALLLTRYPRQVPSRLPAGVRHEAYVPFSRILPRCAAFVHHGGIGTCAQGLAAGVPQLVMPLSFDQPDNGTRLARLGTGRWIVPAQFSGERVADALRGLIGNEQVAHACAQWARAVAAGDGIRETCDLLEEVALNSRFAIRDS